MSSDEVSDDKVSDGLTVHPPGAWQQVVDELTALLDSRWLWLLECCEAPVRIVRPGRGTVRVRLEAIRRHAQQHITAST